MKQLTMSTVSFKLSAYLFILFFPIFFFLNLTADISLKYFLIIFSILFFCITWQKYILKKYDSDGGILNTVKSKTTIPSTILLATCIQFIVLKITTNILIFINMFVMNNLWMINYNINTIMLVIIGTLLIIGYLMLRYGHKNYGIISKAAVFITLIFMGITIINTVPTLFIKSLESLKVISTSDEIMMLTAQLFSIFSVWLLITTTIIYDKKRKKINVIYNIVNFLLIFIILTFIFNKLIGHVPYGENTPIAMFFLLAQTIFYIILFKLYLQRAVHLKIIRGTKKTKFNEIIITSIVATLIILILSRITLEEVLGIYISLMFIIVIVFQFFSMKNLKKSRHIIINVTTITIYLVLLIYVINIYSINTYLIFVMILTYIYVRNVRNKNIEFLEIIENEFHIHDKNGNELRFNYRNNNFYTYYDNLKTTNHVGNVEKVLHTIGINKFNILAEENYTIKTSINEKTVKNVYYISTNLVMPKINISNLNVNQVDQPIDYFWEHKNVGEFGV